MSSQTSDRVSSIAARYVRLTADQVRRADPEALAFEVRSMAASLLRQDETKGLRGIVRKLFTKGRQ